MIRKVVISAVVALFAANVQANTVGLYLGGQIWQSETKGILGEENALIDFNLKKEQQSDYFIAVVHPYSSFPNIRISTTTLDTIGKADSMQEFSFGGEIFPLGGSETSTDTHTGANVNSTTDVNFDANFNVSYLDYTLYYELFNNGDFSFDLGVTARAFNGDVTVIGTSTTLTIVDQAEHHNHVHPATEETTISTTKGKVKTDAIEPMLYVATNINLPLTGLSVFAQSNISLKNEHTLYNYQVALDYDLIDNSLVDFNLMLGYRFIAIKFNDLNNLYTDLEFKGTFIGVTAHF